MRSQSWLAKSISAFVLAIFAANVCGQIRDSGGPEKVKFHGRLEAPKEYQYLQGRTKVRSFRGTAYLDARTSETDGTFTLEHPDAQPFGVYFLPGGPFKQITEENVREVSAPIELEYIFDPGKLKMRGAVASSLRGQLDYLKQEVEELRTLISQLEGPIAQSDLKTLEDYEDQYLNFRPLRILLPAFFDPVTEDRTWKNLQQTIRRYRGKIEFTVVINIASGSGLYVEATQEKRHKSPPYAAQIRWLNANKVKWVGYISARNGANFPVSIEEDFDYWLSTYEGMGGVFLTGIAEKISAERLRSFCQHVRLKYAQRGLPKPLLIGHPAAAIPEIPWTEEGMFDWITIEEDKADLLDFTQPTWFESEQTTEFGVFAYDVDDSQLESLLFYLVSQRAGYIYLSDETPETLRWSNLPSRAFLEKTCRFISNWNLEIQGLNDGR